MSNIPVFYQFDFFFQDIYDLYFHFTIYRDIISKLPDKGQKLRERNILINELLEKHKSTFSNPMNELEDLVNKMSIDDNNKKSYAITPASLVNKKNGRYYSSSVKTNQISIEESIKLQKHQENLRQVLFVLIMFGIFHFINISNIF